MRRGPLVREDANLRCPTLPGQRSETAASSGEPEPRNPRNGFARVPRAKDSERRAKPGPWLQRRYRSRSFGLSFLLDS